MGILLSGVACRRWPACAGVPTLEVAIPPVEEYAEVIGDALRRHLRPGDRPRLILAGWPGGGSRFPHTQVQARKRLADGTASYVLDAGVNLLYTSTWYRHQIELGAAVAGQPEHSVLYGPVHEY